MSNLEQYYKKLSSGFFAFWVVNWRVSLLTVILLFGVGGMSLMNIPKESSPKIEFGIISIVTPYIGVSPVDMDTLITEEIEDAIEDINGINKITSVSSVGIANTTLELENGVDVKDIMIEVKDEVEKLNLPEEAEDSIVTEISTDNELMFQLSIFGEQELFPKERLIELASTIKSKLEGKSGITSIDIEGTDEFDIQILVDKAKAEASNIALFQIQAAVRSFNKNVPIGKYEVDELQYDFRIQGELRSQEDILSIPVLSREGSIVTIGDIATLIRTYKNESIKKLGRYQESGNNSITLTFNKKDGASIFASADGAKGEIEKLFESQEFSGASYVYGNDLSTEIRKDYVELANNFLLTLIGVLFCLLIFVGLKEAIIATLGIILAFFVTFTVLETIDLSLNFLTNFSLILTLGIAIDTSIVIIEAAYEKLKLGFTPKTAVLMAVRDFKAPLIAGTSTTIVVFIPMMILPGITGKFLAYIPITVFITLLAALFIALTVNAALFYILSRSKNVYTKQDKIEQFLSEGDKAILQAEREGKYVIGTQPKSRRNWLARLIKHIGEKKEHMLEKLNDWYEGVLTSIIMRPLTRIWSILIPIILLFVTFFTISPQLGFTLFPDGDNGRFDISIKGQEGVTEENMEKWLPYIEPSLSDKEEIDEYTITINGNSINIGVELLDDDIRKKRGLRNVFDVEKETNEQLEFLKSEGLNVESLVLRGGPPQEKPVALKLIADSNDKFSTLMDIAKQVETYMRGIEGTKNVGVSSKETPGEFVYEFDNDALSTLGLTPDDLIGQIAFAVNGLNAGTINLQGKDADIKILYEQFEDTVSPSDILGLTVGTQAGPIRVGDVMDYRIDNAVAEISRKDGKITVTVSADLEEGFTAQAGPILAQVVEWASQQSRDNGIGFEKGGENTENADLIQATIRGFFIAFFLIFGILVLMFNSYRKPVVILYSVFCAMLGVNIGLWVTGNPYSMPFAIGFIALTGIVVNDAIVFVDKVISNNKLGTDKKLAIVEAGRSRLQPIILTTITTLLGVLPLALTDPFRAGLGYTIIFGLFAGSSMTLFIIPSLYYELILRTGTTWFKVGYWIIMVPPFGLFLLFKRIFKGRGENNDQYEKEMDEKIHFGDKYRTQK